MAPVPHDPVVVSKALLREVLADADCALGGLHMQMCVPTDVDNDGRHGCDKERERIDQLRAQAGIED